MRYSFVFTDICSPTAGRKGADLKFNIKKFPSWTKADSTVYTADFTPSPAGFEDNCTMNCGPHSGSAGDFRCTYSYSGTTYSSIKFTYNPTKGKIEVITNDNSVIAELEAVECD